ncbi:MAG: NUDIX hydrolase [Desulfatitalea sp.]|nr:NUDIX hydrolase [Desulfatitalea sp.]NNK00038.1 NUDIX hydrolase [Desulfatitalea sp.]
MRIIDSTIITQLKFVTLFAVSYLDRKGHTKRWHMVSRGSQPKCITGDQRRPDAVIIVPYHRKAQKLVVIREYRIPVGDYQYGFPAGLIDPGEAPATTAAREAMEETGLELVRIYRQSPAIFSSAGITDETITMVFAEVDGLPTTRHTHDSEQIEIFLMNRQTVQELLQRSDIIFSARAWLAMDAYVRMGRAYLTGDGY